MTPNERDRRLGRASGSVGALFAVGACYLLDGTLPIAMGVLAGLAFVHVLSVAEPDRAGSPPPPR